MPTPPANRVPRLSTLAGLLSRLKIGPKLLLAPGVVLALLLLLSWVAYYAMVRQNDSLESIVGQRATSMRAAASLAAQTQKAHADIYRLLSWMGGSFPVARTEPLRQDILAQHGRIDAGLAALARVTQTGAEGRHVEQAAAAQRRYAQAVREVIELAPLDGSIGANAMQKAESAFALVAQRLADLGTLEEALSREASSSARADFRMISILMPAVLLLAIGLSLAITFAVRRILLGELRGIGLAASGLASGDLTVRQGLDHGYGGDEIADTSRQLDAGIRNLNGTLRAILDSAHLIGAASRDIKLASLSLGSRTVFRTSALAHTERALRELAAGVRLDAAGEGSPTQLDDVGQAIVRMDQVTRQNCTLVEEAASAARTLQMQALVLSRTMAGFRLDEEEEPAATAPAPEAARGDDGARGGGDPARERRGPSRERRRQQASHLRLASSRK